MKAGTNGPGRPLTGDNSRAQPPVAPGAGAATALRSPERAGAGDHMAPARRASGAAVRGAFTVCALWGPGACILCLFSESECTCKCGLDRVRGCGPCAQSRGETHFRFPAALKKRPGSASSFTAESGASALLAKSRDAGRFCSPVRDPAARGPAGPLCAIRLPLLPPLRLPRPGGPAGGAG
ncbi:unnamed protein product [Rangifer tarandus platyrhynchus]|uniref:Uncharacterized protein n=2 Tax=Rangifer tarandus platyrhynchus TaxID=3082113 RepID=A0ACB0FHJ6_RANTA|nr:unnamed protein product [Rangifer tarandus platyrhynchus]CAI9711501.1 unnamed protein product [Rangifer tarandus platyrhynchus]